MADNIWTEEQLVGNTKLYDTSWLEDEAVPRILPMPFGSISYEYHEDEDSMWYRDHGRNDMYFVYTRNLDGVPHIMVEGPQS